ncbi:MAG: TolC family protein [Bacteroidales bacterium]|nr:TolC family protein [Bacteroidales bacterium]MDT8429920.1 TolC family protein [Bacteroidales bacterium]
MLSAVSAQEPALQQDTMAFKLSLQNVIDLAITQSSAIKYAQNTNVNSYWRFRNYQTRFRPQLLLKGKLPEFENTNNPITQQDGSINFRRIRRLSASANLSLNQTIPQTNTSIYAATSVYGINNILSADQEFSSSPIYIGINQPIFQYNWAKWYRKTAPLEYERGQRDYLETIEEIAHRSTALFFSYLRIQTNYELARSNLENSQDNLEIAEVRRGLGTISENDYSRIRLAVLNAQKSVRNADMDLRNADFELKSYINLDQSTKIELMIPLEMTLFYIDPEKALSEAKENKDDVINFQQRLLNAERELEQAKRDNSLSATLSGSYGLSNSSEVLGGIYEQPEQQQFVQLSVRVPILDWGRSASQVKLAESQRDLVLYDVERDMKDFDRRVVVQVERFNLLKEQLKTAEEADKVAENGYKIAQKKFQNGEISITELKISLSERESAKRDYIRSIEDYWESFFYIRILTLYDFEVERKIFYDNPMLEDEDTLL